jgi:hypothetical protein
VLLVQGVQKVRERQTHEKVPIFFPLVASGCMRASDDKCV